jgi:hypothetical protein
MFEKKKLGTEQLHQNCLLKKRRKKKRKKDKKEEDEWWLPTSTSRVGCSMSSRTWSLYEAIF